MPIKVWFIANAFYPASGKHADCTFLVSNSPELNLLGRAATKPLDISVDNLLFSSQVNTISISGEADQICNGYRRNARTYVNSTVTSSNKNLECFGTTS